MQRQHCRQLRIVPSPPVVSQHHREQRHPVVAHEKSPVGFGGSVRGVVVLQASSRGRWAGALRIHAAVAARDEAAWAAGRPLQQVRVLCSPASVGRISRGLPACWPAPLPACCAAGWERRRRLWMAWRGRLQTTTRRRMKRHTFAKGLTMDSQAGCERHQAPPRGEAQNASLCGLRIDRDGTAVQSSPKAVTWRAARHGLHNEGAVPACPFCRQHSCSPHLRSGQASDLPYVWQFFTKFQAFTVRGFTYFQPPRAQF